MANHSDSCVPEEVWNFHFGRYQVCKKWLKDRKGRPLPPTTLPTTIASSSPSTKPSASWPKSTKASTSTAAGQTRSLSALRTKLIANDSPSLLDHRQSVNKGGFGNVNDLARCCI